MMKKALFIYLLLLQIIPAIAAQSHPITVTNNMNGASVSGNFNVE